MRCTACGGELMLTSVLPDETVAVRGVEHHTFICSACQITERRVGPQPERLHLEAGYMTAPVSFRERSDSFPLHRGRTGLSAANFAVVHNGPLDVVAYGRRPRGRARLRHRTMSRNPAKTHHASTRKPKRNSAPTAARPASSALADPREQASALTRELAEARVQQTATSENTRHQLVAR
jgi:hypothetical protein